MTHTLNAERFVESPAPLGPRSASQRVLIVEDEKRLREMLHTSVAEMGLQPTSTGSGESALKLLGQHFFAIAVLDLNLPGINGMQLCERLHEQWPHVQVIILTGFGDLNSARKAIRLEVVDFLIKPCGMDELERALNRARLRWLDRWAGDPAAGDAPIDSPGAVPANGKPVDVQSQRSMDVMERELILAALARHSGNRQSAAEELGISVRKLYYRLQQYQRVMQQ